MAMPVLTNVKKNKQLETPLIHVYCMSMINMICKIVF